jgi:hypothetical protein
MWRPKLVKWCSWCCSDVLILLQFVNTAAYVPRVVYVLISEIEERKLTADPFWTVDLMGRRWIFWNCSYHSFFFLTFLWVRFDLTIFLLVLSNWMLLVYWLLVLWFCRWVCVTSSRVQQVRGNLNVHVRSTGKFYNLFIMTQEGLHFTSK